MDLGLAVKQRDILERFRALRGRHTCFEITNDDNLKAVLAREGITYVAQAWRARASLPTRGEV